MRYTTTPRAASRTGYLLQSIVMSVSVRVCACVCVCVCLSAIISSELQGGAILRTILFGVLAVVLTLRHLNQFRLLTN